MKGCCIAPKGLGCKITYLPPCYSASTHDTTGFTPARLVFRIELHLPCDLFGTTPNKERPTIDHAGNLAHHPHNIHSYAHQHQKLASDQMKTHYDGLTSYTGYHEGEKVCLCCPTQTKGKSPKHQSSWVGLYKVVVCRIQQNPRLRLMVVRLDQLALYHGPAWDKWP
jgi:hypothetical protein